MAGITSVSGLVSGLDTASLISQLMQIEAQTQTTLKSRLTVEQKTLSSLQDLNSAFSSLSTSAGDLAKGTAWNPVAVTSSSPDVVATAGANAVPGPVTFTVNSVAQAHQLSFNTTALMTDTVATGSTVHLAFADGTSEDLATGDGSLSSVINALNASGTGVKASTVQLNDGTYRLQVTSTTTGAGKAFTMTNADGSAVLGGSTVLMQGQDASITVGPDTLTSATNTFSGVVNGLTITLKNGATGSVTLDATQDVSAMSAKVKGLVDSINAALTKIDTLSGYDATTKIAGPLQGDAAIAGVRNSLLDSVYPGDGTSLASVGIQLDRYGKLVFDQSAFEQAYTADPAGVAAKFTSGTTPGFAARVQTAAQGASDPISGTITASISGHNSEIKDLQDSIADWDTRLALKQESLQRQFTALETALSQMNSQSNWLSGQLGSLSQGS
jgi:flagellar hook-associated protein 2